MRSPAQKKRHGFTPRRFLYAHADILNSFYVLYVLKAVDFFTDLC